MPASFAAERTLGRLVKWLRLMGIDTLSESEYPKGTFMQHIGGGRVFLTRTRRKRGAETGLETIYIQANDPTEQAIELVRKAGVRSEDLRPFSRCIICNERIAPVERSAIRRSVPDYVWNTQTHFSTCLKCGRVYWKGSHTECALKKLNYIIKAASTA